LFLVSFALEFIQTNYGFLVGGSSPLPTTIYLIIF